MAIGAFEDQEVAGSSSTNVSKNFTNKKINIQLDEINYPLWKQQVSFALESYGLEPYTDGTQAIPPEFVFNEFGYLVKNPERVSFNKQDKSIASWLLSVVSLDFLPDLVMCQSTTEIWEVIGQLYSAKTTTKVMNIRYSLYSQKKGDQNIRDYLRQLKLIKNNLGICGEKIFDAEHIATILNGLPSEFDSVVTLITTSRKVYDVPVLSSMLINLEARQKSGAMIGVFNVNLATSQSSSHSAQAYKQSTEGVSGLLGYQGRGGSFRRGAFISADGSSTFVNVAIAGEHAWFPDSMATSHLSRDASKVSNSAPYIGIDKLTVANGQSLSISSSG
ncbi:hypothetical protein PVK06_007418 [Gossypium arboreum]|uniref:Retrovirus-related Pol polyprotein from transposon TNT 1-94 n=1 Tax=Gossypium arboreum TaxID=29729 RepID=A0ABR0QI98_GOSAR|nr:hypothetical protein PVK06_007418 [Gossypium arboreum]